MSSATTAPAQIVSRKDKDTWHACEVCHALPPAPLSLCSACRVVQYCSRNHQVRDRPEHKVPCKKIVDARAAVQKAKRALLAKDRKALDPGPENKAYGRLGTSSPEGAAYLAALGRYTHSLNLTASHAAAKESLGIYEEMLRLDRKNEDARNAIPGLLLQFDRDQDAYDFIVWFQRGWKKHGYTYDWLYDDLDKPMLDLHGADPSAEEALELWSRLDDQEIAKLSLERASCAMLIMVRLSLGLAVAVDNQKEFKTKTVVETMKYAHRSFPVGLLELHPEWVEQINDPAFTKTKNGLMGRAAGIALLLADAIKKHNRLYYDMLGKPFMRGGYRDPHEDFDFVTMDDGSQVSLPEARLAFDYTFAAWDRTPGALEHIMSSARENLGL